MIDNIGEMSDIMANKVGKTICFFSAKGGVGKTTNLLNLAGILEQLEKRVLTIDFDLYSGAVATFLNRKFDKSIYHLALDIESAAFNDIHDYTVQVDDYIDIICAPKDPRDANKIEASLIPNIIKNASYYYDAVLIDTNHALNDINLTILDSVDQIYFMMTNDPLDVKNMKSLIAIFKALDINNYKLILNNSRDPFKDYFSLYELKRLVGHNIDYTISVDLYLKEMENLIMKGVIVSLDRKFADVMSDDYHTFLVMATDILKGEVSDE